MRLIFIMPDGVQILVQNAPEMPSVGDVIVRHEAGGNKRYKVVSREWYMHGDGIDWVCNNFNNVLETNGIYLTHSK